VFTSNRAKPIHGRGSSDQRKSSNISSNGMVVVGFGAKEWGTACP